MLIADVPEIRDTVGLQSLAVSRLGKDVVDILDVGVSYDRDVLRDVTWRVAPGERTGILGVNGAGKSTLLGLISGAVQPTTGRVKRGKTVKVAVLTQKMDELDEFMELPVRVVLEGLRTSYTFGTGAKAQELTPGQLLERMGFASAQLSTPVKDLSGGQKRRLQMLLILMTQPNVLILDEPTNDLDTDMLAALEDLLDSWAGTLIVVSHDRYFTERVTDQQYAIIDGQLRHLPGGIDEYLRLRKQPTPARQTSNVSMAPAAASLSAAEERQVKKDIAAVERKMAKLDDQIHSDQQALVTHDPSDHQGLAAAMRALSVKEQELEHLESRWLELQEKLD